MVYGEWRGCILLPTAGPSISLELYQNIYIYICIGKWYTNRWHGVLIKFARVVCCDNGYTSTMVQPCCRLVLWAWALRSPLLAYSAENCPWRSSGVRAWMKRLLVNIAIATCVVPMAGCVGHPRSGRPRTCADATGDALKCEQRIVDCCAMYVDDWFTSVSTMTAIWTVGHRLRSTPTNGHRFTALGLPWWSPIQVLTGVDVT